MRHALGVILLFVVGSAQASLLEGETINYQYYYSSLASPYSNASNGDYLVGPGVEVANAVDNRGTVDISDTSIFVDFTNSADGGHQPKDLLFEGSDDDSDWTTIGTMDRDSNFAGSGGWALGDMDGLGVAYRYIRATQTSLSSGTSDYLVIGEMEFFGVYNPSAPGGGGGGLRRLPNLAAFDTVPADQQVRDANVVAIIPGSDPELAGEAIVVGAHYDHVGIGSPIEDSVFDASGAFVEFSGPG